MKTRQAVSHKQRLDNLFSRASYFSNDIEMMSHWARYLCVLVSGFIEESMCAIYSSYSQDKAAPSVANYVCARLKRVTNLNMEEICQLAGSFNADWRRELEAATTEDMREAVNAIVANRHQIAHGRDVAMSYHRVKGYYGSVVKLVELVEDTVLNES